MAATFRRLRRAMMRRALHIPSPVAGAITSRCRNDSPAVKSRHVDCVSLGRFGGARVIEAERPTLELPCSAS